MATTAQLLDTPRGLRAETVRFDVLDVNLAVVGELRPSQAEVPQVSCDPTRELVRQLSGLTIPSRQMRDLDVHRDRIRPVWVLENGAEFPLGVFVFVEGSQALGADTSFTGSLVDLSASLDDELAVTVSYPADARIADALHEQATAAGAVSVQVAASDKKLGAPVMWPVGDATRRLVMADLCALAGFHAPYFDRHGTLVCEPPADPAQVDLVLDAQVVADSVVEADPFMLGLANRYLVVDTSGEAGAVVGVFEVPETAPHSITRRGYVKTRREDMQGLENEAAAVAAAETLYRQDLAELGDVSLTTTPDPRHDANRLVSWRGEPYVSAWSLSLEPGGEMRHDLRRVWL